MNGWPLILFLSLTLTALVLTVFPVGGLCLVFWYAALVVALLAGFHAVAHKGVRP